MLVYNAPTFFRRILRYEPIFYIHPDNPQARLINQAVEIIKMVALLFIRQIQVML
ncbi:putative translation factor [Actinobacillus equuli]|nr:putative translation factor [Actinobacillus equuli]